MAGKRARVSVLIVNYKVYEDLAACLDALASVLADGETEAIVVDHESDEVRAAEVAAGRPGVRVIPRPDNRGFGAGINEAARHATGELLLVLNPDTRVERNAVETLAAYLGAHPDVVVVGPKVLSPDGSLQATGRRFPSALTGLFGRRSLLTRLWPGNPISRRDLTSHDRLVDAVEVDWVTGTCLMVRAGAFRDVGGFDEAFFLYWEDADLCQRLRRRGGRIMYSPAAVVAHLAARSSDRALAASIVAFHRSALRYYVRYQRGPGRLVAVPFAAVALSVRMMLRLAALPFRR